MNISVRLAKALAYLNNGRQEILMDISDRVNIAGLIDDLEMKMPGIKAAVLEESGGIADHINIYVNGENIRYREGTATVLQAGDKIGFIPAAAAG